MQSQLSSRVVTLILGLIAIGLGWLLWPGSEKPADQPLAVSKSVAFDKQRLGDKGDVPRIANVQIVDLDQDGKNEVLACDVSRNSVILYRPSQSGQWEETVLGSKLKAPAHATLTDLDQDGDQDVVVSILGSITPSDDLMGKVVLLENTEDGFVQHILLDDVRRVADVQAGDLDGDGDTDLAVAVFGYARGEILWLENRGEGKFRDHQLLSRPGVIHVPIRDYDGDGDLDLATVVSQYEEEVWGLENQGNGVFKPHVLYANHNVDLGTGGLVACDLDQDGDDDFLLPCGDNLEYGLGWPQPYHGCVWLENQGDWKFASKTIGTLGGTYAAAAGDVDGDGDQDVVLASMSNNWSDSSRPSLVWLENDGQQNFKMWQVDNSPVELITVDCGDLNQDGKLDIVAGGLHVNNHHSAGIQNVQRVTVWLGKGSGK